ncbi:LysE family translocator [Clostridium sp. BSD9I1]|uniref:LysE family translocator n=1 Tax=Clostridium sp. BSD9I1 TaxID=2003589 RepID=UPI001644F7CF|nr:LysE family transporter [Clostridium sp. BSD9I1]
MMIIIVGIIIGIIVVFPIGPLGIIALQRTINRGWKIGFFSGVGAAVSDLVYSSAAIFGISFVDGFIIKHKYLINQITGTLFLIVGINIFINAAVNKDIEEEERKEIMHPALSNFLLGLSNPMTFLIFLSIFTKMKLENGELLHNLILVISIFTGSLLFWIITSKFVNNSKRNFKIETFYMINKVIGVIISLIGMYSILKGILRL